MLPLTALARLSPCTPSSKLDSVQLDSNPLSGDAKFASLFWSPRRDLNELPPFLRSFQVELRWGVVLPLTALARLSPCTPSSKLDSVQLDSNPLSGDAKFASLYSELDAVRMSCRVTRCRSVGTRRLLRAPDQPGPCLEEGSPRIHRGEVLLHVFRERLECDIRPLKAMGGADQQGQQAA